jgi:hypothetical protein
MDNENESYVRRFVLTNASFFASHALKALPHENHEFVMARRLFGPRRQWKFFSRCG